MKIIIPPYTTNTESNLTKQVQVFEECFQAGPDVAIFTTQDCPILDEVHSPDHMHRAKTLGINGFGGIDHAKVAHAEYSSSAMVKAAELACTGGVDGRKICFAPVSGFHHAGYNHMGGFCTFNGLIAAIFHVRRRCLADRILIIDGDGHFGDGTENMISHHNLGGVDHIPMNKEDLSGLADLRNLIAGYDLVLYQAGADAYYDDPYGAGTLHLEDWVERDQQIFDMCKEFNVPIAWNLAGGYHPKKTVRLHQMTFNTACQVFESDKGRMRLSTYRGSVTVDPKAPDHPFYGQVHP
jgi:acetoin utilization deacetylase AcuC-like enzyme